MCSPFLNGLTFCVSYGNANLPQHLLIDLTDRRSQRPDGFRGIKIENRHEIFMVEILFRLQATAGHERISDTDSCGCFELDFDVKAIIFL